MHDRNLEELKYIADTICSVRKEYFDSNYGLPPLRTLEVTCINVVTLYIAAKRVITCHV